VARLAQWGGSAAAIGRVSVDDFSYSRTELAGGTVLSDLVFGPDGWLWFAEYEPGSIRRLDPVTSHLDDVLVTGDLGRPLALMPNPAGPGVWVAIESNLIVLVLEDGTIAKQIPLAFQAVDGVAVDGSVCSLLR
jgi:streptogramin lyase